MFSNIIMAPQTCSPVLYSRAVGLPVTGCSEVDRRARQQRQELRKQVRARQAATSKAGQLAQSLERPTLDSVAAITSGMGSLGGGQQQQEQQQAGRQQAAGQRGEAAQAQPAGSQQKLAASAGRRLLQDLKGRLMHAVHAG